VIAVNPDFRDDLGGGHLRREEQRQQHQRTL
jgi:hypothetical protein